MVRIRFPYRKLINERLKSRAEFYYEKMNGNPKYVKYQPLVTDLGALFAPFTTALANFKLGGSDRTAAKNAVQTDIIDTLDAITRELGNDANAKGLSQEEGEALVKDAGFDIVEPRTIKPKKVITYLAAPTGFRVIDEKKQGSVYFEWDENNDAVTYVILDSVDDVHWQVSGVSNESPVVLSGFPSKANKTFCIFAISDGTVMSDKSEPVTVWVS